MLPREQLRGLVYTENVTTLLQDGLQKVVEGITSFNEIYKLIEIDDELDSHYSADLLNSDEIIHEEEQKDNKPTETIVSNEDSLGQTEILDLGTTNNN